MKFRSCGARRIEGSDVDLWDGAEPEGSFYWTEEEYRGDGTENRWHGHMTAGRLEACE